MSDPTISAQEVYQAQRSLERAREDAGRVSDDLYWSLPPQARDTEKVENHPDVKAAREAAEALAEQVAALQAKIGGRVYRIATGKLSALQDRIEKLNRKAAKLGTEPLVLTVTDERDEEVRRETNASQEVRDIYGAEAVSRERVYTFVYVILSGSTPMVPGFAFIAALDHTADQGADEGVAIRRVPPLRFRRDTTEERAREELESIDLTRFRQASPDCVHCGHNRQRNTTYVLYELATGELRQVGSTCLGDYTGANNPDRVASWAEWLAALDRDLSVDPFDDEGFGGGGRYAEPTLKYLTHVAAVTRENGWTPRWRNGERTYGATADQAHENIRSYGRTRRDGTPDFVPTTDEDAEIAEKALAWVRDDLGERTDLDEFQHNLVTYARSDYLPEKGDGFVAYIVQAYRRETEKRIERERTAEAAATSEYIASVGDRIDLTFTVSFIREFPGDYGTRYLTKGHTPEGNRVTWWASKPLEQGTTYRGKATVKAHAPDKYAADAKTTEIKRFTGQPLDPDEIPQETGAVVEDAAKREAAAAKRKAAKEKREAEQAAANQAFYERALCARDVFRATVTTSERAAHAEADTKLPLEEFVLDLRAAKRAAELEAEDRLLPAEECLEYGEDCHGPVTLVTFDGLKSFPRCDHHAAKRAEAQEEINRKYGGVAPPPDFDPAYAGERWDED